MRKKEEPYKNVIIAGGGKCSRVAKIESNHRVKIIDSNHERAKRLSEIRTINCFRRKCLRQALTA